MGMFSDGCLIAPNVGVTACLWLTSMPMYLGIILFLAFCLESGFGHSLLLTVRILLLFPGMGRTISMIFQGDVWSHIIHESKRSIIGGNPPPYWQAGLKQCVRVPTWNKSIRKVRRETDAEPNGTHWLKNIRISPGSLSGTSTAAWSPSEHKQNKARCGQLAPELHGQLP